MFGERKVSLQFTERAKDYIERFKATAGLRDPILTIKWSKWSDEPFERWMIGFNDRSRVQEGWLGITPELEFVVIQEWVLDALEGKTLDITKEGVSISKEPT
jgi:hypothetical protein